MTDNFSPEQRKEINPPDERLVEAIREALLNLEGLEGEMKLVKRRLASHLSEIGG